MSDILIGNDLRVFSIASIKMHVKSFNAII